jgi:hypothetical protein
MIALMLQLHSRLLLDSGLSEALGGTGTSGHNETGSGLRIIPCDGDVAIPLCARVRSVALFRLPLGCIGR